MGSDIIILAESDISQRKNVLPLVKKKVYCFCCLSIGFQKLLVHLTKQ